MAKANSGLWCACAALFGITSVWSFPASADYFDDVAANSRCWSNCDIPVFDSPDPGSYDPIPTYDHLANYRSFQDLMGAFRFSTRIADTFLGLPDPQSQYEYEQRVSEFYVAAFRESDYLLQARDVMLVRRDEAYQAIERDRAYVQVNGNRLPALESEFESARAVANRAFAEKMQWVDNTVILQQAEEKAGRSASIARYQVFDLISVAAPPDALILQFEHMAAAESLVPPLPVAEPLAQPPMPLFTAQPAEPSAPWQPVDRALPIDVNAPTDVKVEQLRALEPQMAATAREFDVVFAELKGLRPAVHQAAMDAIELGGRISKLEWDIGDQRKNAEAFARETPAAQEEYRVARDQFTLRAVQSWMWNEVRDEIVVPGVQDFLIANGIQKAAGDFADPAQEAVEWARNAKWSDFVDIRGIDEFMEVQKKVIGLFDPAQSSILQAAEINALATPEEGARFAQSMFQSLGDQATEFFQAAGGAHVEGPYRELLTTLMAADQN